MLMNVLKELMNVMNTVTIPLVVILVTVLDLAINFTVMETHVKVYESYPAVLLFQLTIVTENVHYFRYQ